MRGPPLGSRDHWPSSANGSAHGLGGKRNGELLKVAEGQFDVFVTVDSDLPKQHDISQYNLAVVILIARSNRLADLKPLMPQLIVHLNSIKAGDVVEIA